MEADGDGVALVEDEPAGVEEAPLEGVGGGGGVAGAEASAERGADRSGEHGEHNIEVDVERDRRGEGVEVEGPDGLGESLLDRHAAGIALDELLGGGAHVVGDHMVGVSRPSPRMTSWRISPP